MRILWGAAAALVLTGCGAVDSARRMVSSADVRVQEVARTPQCASADAESRVTLFRDLQTFKDWQTARGLALLDDRSWTEAPHALVELGRKPSGGHGLAVSRAARLRADGDLTLSAMVVEPSPTASAATAETAPCVLVRLPKHDYRSIEVRDQAGRLRASSDVAVPPTATPEPPPAAPADVPSPSSWWPF